MRCTRVAQQPINILIAEAIAHHEAGRLDEADAAYRLALAAEPTHPAILHNLGLLAVSRGDRRAAIGWFDEAIASRPGYLTAHLSRASALQELGMIDAALAGLATVVANDPDHYEAHRRLGFLYLARHDRGRALDHLARTYELRRGSEAPVPVEPGAVLSPAKLRHDIEQFHYLAAQRPRDPRFPSLARAYESVAETLADASLTAAKLGLLGGDFNRAIYMADAPEIADGAVSARSDAQSIVERVAEDGVAWFDDLLTSAALASLRRYLLQSTIWHDFSHIEGFVASYLQDGLACPLLLQVVDEIRTRFAPLLAEHPLTQAWAFKGLKAQSAVDAHADDAAYSINFWITPDEANLDANSGGLCVCRADPPEDWKIKDYAGDRVQVAAFLNEHRESTTQISYKANRAVLFRSRLFHHTATPTFDTSYEHRRINITLLFGR
jgi:tetratricopeptide (TPR) repeat protein